MKFTAKVKLGNTTYTVSYETRPNGRYYLSGDRIAVDVLKLNARNLDGIPMGPVGMYTDRDHLREPLSVIPVMEETFDEILELTGDLPEAPDVPEGTIC